MGEHVARMRKVGNSSALLVRKPELKNQSGELSIDSSSSPSSYYNSKFGCVVTNRSHF
jgi:hypothetical protein